VEEEMKITIMDFKTKEVAVIEPSKELEDHTVLFSYSDGNDGCDCNRSLEFDRVNGTSTHDEIESVVGEDVCFREERFVVVDVEGYSGDKGEFLEEVNNGYSKENLDACMKEYRCKGRKK
jgi:hypothetical protein